MFLLICAMSLLSSDATYGGTPHGGEGFHKFRHLHDAFDNLDTNGDGMVDLEEFSARAVDAVKTSLVEAFTDDDHWEESGGELTMDTSGKVGHVCDAQFETTTEKIISLAQRLANQAGVSSGAFVFEDDDKGTMGTTFDSLAKLKSSACIDGCPYDRDGSGVVGSKGNSHQKNWQGKDTKLAMGQGYGVDLPTHIKMGGKAMTTMLWFYMPLTLRESRGPGRPEGYLYLKFESNGFCKTLDSVGHAMDYIRTRQAPWSSEPTTCTKTAAPERKEKYTKIFGTAQAPKKCPFNDRECRAAACASNVGIPGYEAGVAVDAVLKASQLEYCLTHRSGCEMYVPQAMYAASDAPAHL